MATRYWKTTSNTNLGTSTNWTGTGSLSTADDLIIDLSGSAAAVAAGVPSTGVISNITITTTVTVNSITIVYAASNPVTTSGTSTVTLGGSAFGGAGLITASNTTWNATGLITIIGYGGSTSYLNTNGATLAGSVTITLAGSNGTVKVSGLTKIKGTLTLPAGNLDISDYDIYCGIFSSNSTGNTRNIAFGSNGKGIYLDNTATATIFLVSGTVTGLTTTGTTKVVVTNAGNYITKTITCTGTNSGIPVPFSFYFVDTNPGNNTNTIVITKGAYFTDFDCSSWYSGSFVGPTTSGTMTIYNKLKLYPYSTWTVGTTSTFVFDNTYSTNDITVDCNGVSACGINVIGTGTNNINIISAVSSSIPFLVNLTNTSSTAALNINANVSCTTFTISNVFTNVNINNNAVVTCSSTVSHGVGTLNIVKGQLKCTTYALGNGSNSAILNINDTAASSRVLCSGEFSMGGSGTVNFADNANKALTCLTFYIGNTYNNYLNGNYTTNLVNTNKLPTQIEITGRTSSYAVTINLGANPTVTDYGTRSTGNVGFIHTGISVGTCAFYDATNLFSYTINTVTSGAQFTGLGSNPAYIRGLDLSNYAGNNFLLNTYGMYISGDFYDNTSVFYATAYTGSTKSTGTIYLTGGTSTTPNILDLKSNNANYNLNVSGYRTVKNTNIPNTYFSIGILTLSATKGCVLDLSDALMTITSYQQLDAVLGTQTNNVIVYHNSGTKIRLSAAGAAGGNQVFSLFNGTFSNNYNKNKTISKDGTQGTISLLVQPSGANTLQRYVSLPQYDSTYYPIKLIDAFKVDTYGTGSATDQIIVTGLVNAITLNSFSGGIAAGYGCGSFSQTGSNTINIINNSITAWSDDTAGGTINLGSYISNANFTVTVNGHVANNTQYYTKIISSYGTERLSLTCTKGWCVINDVPATPDDNIAVLLKNLSISSSCNFTLNSIYPITVVQDAADYRINQTNPLNLKFNLYTYGNVPTLRGYNFGEITVYNSSYNYGVGYLEVRPDESNNFPLVINTLNLSGKIIIYGTPDSGTTPSYKTTIKNLNLPDTNRNDTCYVILEYDNNITLGNITDNTNVSIYPAHKLLFKQGNTFAVNGSTINFTVPLKIGPYSSFNPGLSTNTAKYIQKVSSGYSVANFSTDYFDGNYVINTAYVGTTTTVTYTNKFFLMF